MINKNRFIVIDENGDCVLFPSLRQSASHASVSHTTLSKKLRNSERCTCRSRRTRKAFLIIRLDPT